MSERIEIHPNNKLSEAEKLEIFIHNARLYHGDKYDYSLVRYVRAITPITVICPEHGEWVTNINKHTTPKKPSTCPKCQHSPRKCSTEHWISRAQKKHGDTYSYENAVFTGGHKLITITCKIHGDFDQMATSHMAGAGCGECSGSGKLTNKIFLRRAKELHGERFDYKDVDVNGMHEPVSIECPEHGVQQITPKSHLYSECGGCPECNPNTKYTTETFIKKARAIHGDYYDYSKVEYVSMRDWIIVICPEHGEWKTNGHIHTNGGSGCNQCGHAITGEKTRLTQEEFLRRSTEQHGNKFDYSLTKYNTIYDPVTITCPKHGDFTQVAATHMKSTHGCQKCANEAIGDARRYTQEQYLERVIQRHDDRYDYSLVEYTSTKEKITIICHRHGEFKQEAYSHMNGANCRECVIEDMVGLPRRRDGVWLTTETYITKAVAIHGDRYDYSRVEYKGALENITVGCDVHGWVEQSAYGHLNSRGCNQCSSLQRGLARRRTNEKFIELATEKHDGVYDYTNTVYEKSEANVTVECKKHGPFDVLAARHIRGQGCPSCYVRKTKGNITTFLEAAEEKFGDRYDYTNVEYNGTAVPVEIICSEHGTFFQTPWVHLNAKYGCPRCAGTGKILLDEFLIRANEAHNNFYDYSLVTQPQLTNQTSKPFIICPEHGVFRQRASKHMRGEGCQSCATNRVAEFHRLSTEEFIERAREAHGDLYDYSLVDYQAAILPVKIICDEHGIFEQTPHAHTGVQPSKCPTCSIRKNHSELRVGEYLKKHFSFLGEMQCGAKPPVLKENTRFKGMSQHFDYWFPEHDIAVEYQGKQHYEPIELFGGKAAFLMNMERDERKRNICEENDVVLIEIPYYEFDMYTPSGEADDYFLVMAEMVKEGLFGDL